MNGQLHRVLRLLAGLRLPQHAQSVQVSQDYGTSSPRAPSAVTIEVVQRVPGLSSERATRHVWTHLELELLPDDLLVYQIDTILENFQQNPAAPRSS